MDANTASNSNANSNTDGKTMLVDRSSKYVYTNLIDVQSESVEYNVYGVCWEI